MSQIGFFLGEAGVGVFGIPAGVSNLILAWDPFDSGPGGGLGLVYQDISAASVLGGGRVRNLNPIKVAPYKSSPGGLFRQGRTLKFKLEGGSAMTGTVDLTFQVFEDSKLIYSAATGTGQDTLKIEVKGFTTASTFTFVGRMKNIHDEDDAIFDALMTPDGQLMTM